MKTRLLICLTGVLVVVMLIAYRHSADSRHAFTRPAIEWDVRQVRLIGADPFWQDRANPGLYPVSPVDVHGDPSMYAYASAAAGLLPKGNGAVVGCLGSLYPWASFEVVSFGRSGTNIQIVLRYHSPADTAFSRKQKYSGKYAFFSARFPYDLPDGHYTVTCTVIGAPAPPALDGTTKPSAPAPLLCTFDLFDPPEAARNPLAHLSDQELLDEYISRGTELKGSGVEPIDGYRLGMAMMLYRQPRYEMWQAARWEIIRRGAPMVPQLVDLLKHEVPRNASATDDAYVFGFARDLMETLTRIGDPRPAPVLVDILGGYSGQANLALRKVALDSLQKLTCVTFVRYLPHEGYYYIAVPDPSATHAADLAAQAAKYRAWMNADGRDSAKWLDMARARARALLDGDDLNDAYCAVSFLQFGRDGVSLDDDPDRTMASVARIIQECRRREQSPVSGSDWRARQEKDPYATPASWLQFAGRAGPRARAYAPSLVQIHRGMGYFRDVIPIGGEEVMAYLMERFPDLDARRAQLGVERTAEWAELRNREDTEKRGALMAYQECRWGIERWAGRPFADDKEIAVWWQANKGRSQEQWLADGLEPTAAQADSGNAKAQHLIHLLLPDLPRADGEWLWSPPPSYVIGDFRVKPIPPFRVAWLRQHRHELIYDAQAGGFRLQRPATAPGTSPG